MNNAELRARIQRDFTGASLSSTQWDDIVLDAVRAYSRHRPLVVLGSITTQVDVEEYPLPAGGHSCLEVADFDELADLTALGFSLLDISSVQGDVIIDFHQPQQLDIYRQKVSARRRQVGTQWEPVGAGESIRLMPRPQSVMTLSVLYTVPHALADTIPEPDEDLLLMAAGIGAKRKLANAALVAAAGTTSGVEMRLGPYTYRPGGLVTAAKLMLDDADREQKAFDSKAFQSAVVMKGAP